MKPRISVKEAVEAFETTGAEPMPSTMVYRHGSKVHACAIGAAALARRVRDNRMYDWAEKRYGTGYTDGFMDGFDANQHIRTTGRWNTGYNDGVKCRQAILTNRVQQPT
jgi:hypothetical protein